MKSRHGFTVVELLAILVVLGVTASVLATSMAGTRMTAPAFQCWNNLKQLTTAWNMYADDNHGRLVYNSDGTASGLNASSPAWVGGWLDFTGGQPLGSDTNTDLLVNHAKYPYTAFLGPYIRSPAPFKCPADRSTVTIVGKRFQRVRSVSMNNYLGVDSRTWSLPSRYPLCTSAPQIRFPAGMFAILDERADSINDGMFLSDPDTRWQLIDYPAAYHNGSGSFSFADGHVEGHRWRDARTNPVLQPGQLMPLNQNFPGNVDVLWLQQHAAGARTFP